jgi:hypothetical protein
VSEVLSSMSELMRVGGWALRGLGYPFGAAERGIRFVAWTEAVGGEAIAGLRRAEPMIASSIEAPTTTFCRDASGGWLVAAHNRHLVEVGPPAIDLATADARANAIGHVALGEVFGFELATSLADLLVRRGLVALLVYRVADGETGNAARRGGWLIAGGTERPVFTFGSTAGDARKALWNALGTGEPAAEMVARDMDDANGSTSLGYLGATALAPESPIARRLLEHARSSAPGTESIDYVARLQNAYRDGIPMQVEDLQYLYDLEMRTWAPTSERSRAQAGYGVY